MVLAKNEYYPDLNTFIDSRILFGPQFEKLETGDYDEAQYIQLVKEELENAGFDGSLPGKMMLAIKDMRRFVRGLIIDVIHALKRHGYVVVALTNNWGKPGAAAHVLEPLFHQVFQVRNYQDFSLHNTSILKLFLLVLSHLYCE